ncbi:bifunctional 2-polyprenyl-6-hydroxyphenol methylase/3-demethylubiquinol 3-O-methyltransferase UbiG [Malikia sp.]|uniref:class I SAM-dependent methyltransferase n=1 Tax=Malikia sp. TaxID=2070706 RepID=UPI00261ADD73|nr:class I SAM-dependent methyltransferase [Malikia sp.]MDD2729881.1 class I SAM-dependent methyltransferase [Malikia sp.]
MTIEHNTQAPSDWVRRWGHLVPDRPGGARVLDLACGSGRHSRWLMRQGHQVTAVDRDAQALAGLAELAPWVRTLRADLENGPWPLAGREFEAVVVTNYLWRPLWPDILASLAPGGLLIHETFAHGNASVGRPSRPDFLLQPGELLRACAELRVVAYEDGFLTHPERYVQRIAAVRESGAAEPAVTTGDKAVAPPRHALHGAG